MVARCVIVEGEGLGEPERGLLYTDETVFHLTVGSDYLVMGMALFQTGLIVLVRDDTGRPNWYPIGLFYLVDQTIPADWEFAITDAKSASGVGPAEGVAAQWGYRELIQTPSHHEELIERVPSALKIFEAEFARQIVRD